MYKKKIKFWKHNGMTGVSSIYGVDGILVSTLFAQFLKLLHWIINAGSIKCQNVKNKITLQSYNM